MDDTRDEPAAVARLSLLLSEPITSANRKRIHDWIDTCLDANCTEADYELEIVPTLAAYPTSSSVTHAPQPMTEEDLRIGFSKMFTLK